jgi:hypothetical protein
MQNIKSNTIYDKTIKVLLIFMVLISFSSCKKECSIGCEPKEPDSINNITFNLNGKSIQSDYFLYKGIQNGKYREMASRASDENVFRLVKEYCESKNISLGNEIFAYALYYDTIITKNYLVTDQQIKGVSVFSVKGRRIIHHLFMKNEICEFYEVENVRVAVEGISEAHLHYYLENYVFTNTQNKTVITTKGNFANEIYKRIKKYKTSFRYEVKNTSKENTPGSTPECNSYFRCAWFPSGIRMPCVEGFGGKPECSGRCAAQQMVSELELENISQSAFININLMYSFRDDFLDNYNKGNEYIDNYYFLSEEFKDNISISLALKTALFFFDFNSVMAAFVNPENHLTEIMFTEELTQDLLDLLDDYEEITNSTEGKAILASIRADINSFKNKQLQEILAMIN